MSRDVWMFPFKQLHQEEPADDHGRFRLRVIDFSRSIDGRPLQIPAGLKPFGWILVTGGPNDPVVGDEASFDEAYARARAVRSAICVPLAKRDGSDLLKCAGCGVESDYYLEPCSGCGKPTCEGCMASKGGCGAETCGGSVADRGVPLTREMMNSLERSVANATAAIQSPTSHRMPTQADIEVEAARLQAAADVLTKE